MQPSLMTCMLTRPCKAGAVRAVNPKLEFTEAACSAIRCLIWIWTGCTYSCKYTRRLLGRDEGRCLVERHTSEHSWWAHWVLLIPALRSILPSGLTLSSIKVQWPGRCCASTNRAFPPSKSSSINLTRVPTRTDTTEQMVSVKEAVEHNWRRCSAKRTCCAISTPSLPPSQANA